MTSASRGPGAVIVRAQRRFRSRRHSGTRRILRRTALVAGIVVALGLGGWLLAHSSWFALRYVTVEGTSRLTATQVLDAASVREGSSLVGLDPDAIAHRVERLAPVRVATVSRKWPHGLVIRIVERTAAAVAIGPSGPWLVDGSGVAFAHVNDVPDGLTHVNVSAAVPGAGAVAAQAGMHVLSDLPPRLRRLVADIAAPSADDISVQLSDGRTIVWGSPQDSGTKAAVLRALLKRPARVYDVSTPSVAVTRG